MAYTTMPGTIQYSDLHFQNNSNFLFVSILTMEREILRQILNVLTKANVTQM